MPGSPPGSRIREYWPPVEHLLRAAWFRQALLLLRRSFHEFFADHCQQMAAAISFHLLHELLTSVTGSAGALGLLGIIGMIWAASGVMAAIRITGAALGITILASITRHGVHLPTALRFLQPLAGAAASASVYSPDQLLLRLVQQISQPDPVWPLSGDIR